MTLVTQKVNTSALTPYVKRNGTTRQTKLDLFRGYFTSNFVWSCQKYIKI